MTFGLFPFGTDAFGATSSGGGGAIVNASLPAFTAVVTVEDRFNRVSATLPAFTAAITAAPTIEGDVIATLPAFTAAATTTNAYPPPEDYPLGIREYERDFEKGHLTANLSTTKRPDALTFDYLVGFSLGPVAFGDLSKGVINYSWYARADNPNKKVVMARRNEAGDGWLPETDLFHFTGEQIEELDFAFEQAGRPVVCAERLIAGVREVWQYWFKPFVGDFVFEKMDNGRSPRVVLDNPPDISNSDVQLFYLKTGTGLVNRIQHEAYAVAHVTPHVVEPDWYLEDVFYTNNWRVAAVLVNHNWDSGKYSKKRLETALMPVFMGPADNNMTFSGALLALEDRLTLFSTVQVPEQFQFPFGLTSLDNGPILVFFTQPPEDFYQFPISMQSLDDHVALLFATMFDTDNFQYPFSLTSIADPVIVITHTMHDTDNWQYPLSLTSIDDS